MYCKCLCLQDNSHHSPAPSPLPPQSTDAFRASPRLHVPHGWWQWTTTGQIICAASSSITIPLQPLSTCPTWVGKSRSWRRTHAAYVWTRWQIPSCCLAVTNCVGSAWTNGSQNTVILLSKAALISIENALFAEKTSHLPESWLLGSTLGKKQRLLAKKRGGYSSTGYKSFTKMLKNVKAEIG